MKKEDMIIYVCVIIGAGIGLLFHHAILGVLIGLVLGYIFKSLLFKQKNGD